MPYFLDIWDKKPQIFTNGIPFAIFQLGFELTSQRIGFLFECFSARLFFNTFLEVSMKKSLWILSALAMVGFAFTGCSNDCETNDDCADGEYCIEALVASAGGNEDTDSVEVGDMFCSACQTDCQADAAHPVCVTSLHVCGARATCDGGQMPTVGSDGYATCISETTGTCKTNADCEKEGYVCGPQNVCIPGTEDKFKYVRIDDNSDPCKKNAEGKCTQDDPGADIDAVVLNKSDGTVHYAERVVGYLRSDGVKERVADSPIASDPSKALGKPDSFKQYPEKDGKCIYYTDSSFKEHPYVSLGGQGGYITLEMGGTIDAGDRIDVLEVGACSLQNTKDGKSDTAVAEPIKLSVSVSGADGSWKEIGELTADTTNKGILSFTVSEAKLK